jgi:hypothetical protein
MAAPKPGSSAPTLWQETSASHTRRGVAWSLRRSAYVGGRELAEGRSQSDALVGGHSLVDHGQQLGREGVQVDLLSKPCRERLHGAGGVVVAAVEAPVDQVLDPAAHLCGASPIQPVRAGATAVGFIVAVTATPTGRCIWRSWSACAGVREPEGRV